MTNSGRGGGGGNGPPPTAFHQMSIEQLERALRIDEHELQHCSRTQPELLYEVGKRLALLISQRDRAKRVCKEEEARADGRVRHDAEVHDEKMTDKIADHKRVLDREFMVAKDRMYDLEEKVGLMWALKESFQSRGDMLKGMIELYKSNYYGSEMERSSSNALRSANTDRIRRQHAEMTRERRS